MLTFAEAPLICSSKLMLLQYEIVLIFWFNIGLCFVDVIYSRCIQYVLIIGRPKHLKLKHYNFTGCYFFEFVSA